jgi:RNA polymerase sigma-70 factor, ECF subfamily
MMTTRSATQTANRPFLAVLRKDGKQVAQVSPELSPLTVMMLAVRDRRDRAAFAALFDHFAPRLKGFIMRSGSSAAQAEDIVQEVLLTVWRKADQFDPERAQVSAWIYQIARNRQIDTIRKTRRPLPEDWPPEDGDTDPGLGQDAATIVALAQEADLLQQALAGLQPSQREMIEKAYMGELSHQEISALTGLPLGTIKSRIRLGLDRLRHALKDIR